MAPGKPLPDYLPELEAVVERLHGKGWVPEPYALSDQTLVFAFDPHDAGGRRPEHRDAQPTPSEPLFEQLRFPTG
ncbi:MAG: hypothetical protein IPO80_04610 [Propionibacteriaceae bacterium]|nr:hypothetical protein [Propionibacteriaceae bacterium]